METDFTRATNTLILSDIHLSDAEPPHPNNPLWKRYKRPKLFVDRSFKRFIEHMQAQTQGQMELVLNGDIFDFDSVMSIPEDADFKMNWLEKSRGLNSEEEKSLFKMHTILDDHPIWVEAIRNFIMADNHLVFVIGNHDMELHWPKVREELLNRFDLPPEKKSLIRFCEWFYISNADTLIEHGNQYDPYCMNFNPIHPLIKKGSKISVRIPFGNLAGKYMLNGMGLLNPHADTTFIMSARQYVVFFLRYLIRTQPFMLWTWLWSATATFIVSVTEGLLPALRDPLTVEARVEDIAHRSNATPGMVRSLVEVHAHPAIFNPVKIMKELWLDRAFLLLGVLFLSFEFFSVLNVITPASIWWFFAAFLILMPLFVYYARSVQSNATLFAKIALDSLRLTSQLTKVGRVIQGHTHHEIHTWIDGVEHINTGTWSPAYHDVECTKPFGRKCFAWLRPNPESGQRFSELYEWKDPGIEIIPPQSGEIRSK